jgi:hypothetical protein
MVPVFIISSNIFDRAVALYSERPDKDWGLTDCISFVVMQDHGLTQVLAFDRHFEQAGSGQLLALSEALLDFTTLEDLNAWLATQADAA